MEKSYQKYLNSVMNEAEGDKSFTPALTHADSDERPEVNLTKKLKQSITDIVSSMPELKSYSSDIDALSEIVANAVDTYEHDSLGQPIDATREDGISTLSQNFVNSNPLMKSLYLLAASQLSDQYFDYNKKLPFLLLKAIKTVKPDMSIADIAQLSMDDWKPLDEKLQTRNSALAKSFDELIKSGRFEPLSSNKTLSGINVGKTKPTSKSKLIQMLHKLDRDQFDINASTYGNNYQDVSKENEIMVDYLQSRLPKGSTEKLITNKLSSEMNKLFSNKEIFLDNLDPRIKELVSKTVNDINANIKDLTDSNEINSYVRSAINDVNGPNRETNRIISRYYSDFLTQIKSIKTSGVNQNIKTPIPPKSMKAIIDSVYNYNRDIISSNIPLLDFISVNYAENDPEDVMGYFVKRCKAGGGCKSIETSPLKGDDVSLARDTNTPVSLPTAMSMYKQTDTTPKHKGTVSEPKNLNDLMSRVRVVDTPKKDRGPVGDLRKKKTPQEDDSKKELSSENVNDSYPTIDTRPKHKGTVTPPTEWDDIKSKAKVLDTPKKDRVVGPLKNGKRKSIKEESFYDTMVEYINE